MKYGVLFNKNNVNLGDDIQAYATARFYPSLDYFVDREHIHEFRSENNEPVAVIMNAWYMWEKWHWPPARCIVPHMVGIHYADHELSLQPGSPLKYEALEGLGGEYLKAYAPIGCRDYYTMNQMKKLGIDSYFSGCITLTLPQMPIVRPEKEYICIVDVDARVKNRLVKLLENSGYELKIMTHTGERDENRTWEQRKKKVEELLTTYRNAKCVITKKLHCSLPCLSQGTPVVLIKQMDDDIRFSPYYDFLHYIKTDPFSHRRKPNAARGKRSASSRRQYRPIPDSRKNACQKSLSLAIYAYGFPVAHETGADQTGAQKDERAERRAEKTQKAAQSFKERKPQTAQEKGLAVNHLFDFYNRLCYDEYDIVNIINSKGDTYEIRSTVQ